MAWCLVCDGTGDAQARCTRRRRRKSLLPPPQAVAGASGSATLWRTHPKPVCWARGARILPSLAPTAPRGTRRSLPSWGTASGRSTPSPTPRRYVLTTDQSDAGSA
eukprot:7994747-Pyramimonas_sp.AAC.1